MSGRFPLSDVQVRMVSETRSVMRPDYADAFWQMNQNEFAMQVEGVGSFYACHGSEVEYALLAGADEESVELYLNGSVYGAILHQRRILPLHGSSFVYCGKAIMICGETGAGKSSVTASFVVRGAEFLTDDVTPVVFKNEEPFIPALSDRIKLWDHSLDQLRLEKAGLKKVAPYADKFYLPINSEMTGLFPLQMVMILEVHDQREILFSEVRGAEKVSTLRSEVYRWEYLRGMKENETLYFHNIVSISMAVRVIRVSRPATLPIEKLRDAIVTFLNRDD